MLNLESEVQTLVTSNSEFRCFKHTEFPIQNNKIKENAIPFFTILVNALPTIPNSQTSPGYSQVGGVDLL